MSKLLNAEIEFNEDRSAVVINIACAEDATLQPQEILDAVADMLMDVLGYDHRLEVDKDTLKLDS